ncbi:hypothetical protein [Allosphingosinicella indica]|uniref:Flagellar protein FliS n=1 Tax=Allosphingosinicella indica TaxID=941907 RepID=A0A1X7FZI2_9SPHN|nr:hypothetical protein [Allosphingosinicella indica]SMF61528.1 hypothetical protein SAMN06295910_0518 [Allosphingosinicella indica]
MQDRNQADIYVSIYQAMNLAADEPTLPRGAHGALARGIDRLRAEDATPRMIGQAEAAYVAIHRLEWALMTGDDRAATCARSALSDMAGAWLADAPVSRFS